MPEAELHRIVQRNRRATEWYYALAWSLVAGLINCAGAHREPCTHAEANRIDAWYQTEIAERCAVFGFNTSNCPDMEEIDEEYDRKYDEWVACSGQPKQEKK